MKRAGSYSEDSTKGLGKEPEPDPPQQVRASVRVTIETMLDKGLPRAYTPEVYQEKSDLVYQHVFDNYFGAGRSVYAVAA